MPAEQDRSRSAVADGVALGAAVGVFGVAFGILATTTGTSVAQACAMSLLVFTGASQFAIISSLAAGSSLAPALAGALLLAARNGVYGIAMAPWLRARLPIRLIAAHLVIDESTGLATAQRDPDDVAPAFWSTGLSVFVFWNVGTLVGAVGGSHLAAPEAFGLDAAFPAGFVALLLPHLDTRLGRQVAALAAVITVSAIPLSPPGLPILLAALALGLALRSTPGRSQQPRP